MKIGALSLHKHSC